MMAMFASKLRMSINVLGEMEMTASFAGVGDLSGRVYNAVGDDGFKYGSELDLDNFILDRIADISNASSNTDPQVIQLRHLIGF